MIVFWHLLTNKKTFCPRFGSTILNIKLNIENSIAAVLLQSNSLKLIKLNNFEQVNVISSITNPSIYKNTIDSQHPSFTFTGGFVEYPKTRKKRILSIIYLRIIPADALVMESMPGHIQFVDPLQMKKIKDFTINRRNITSRVDKDYPNPLTVNHVDSILLKIIIKSYYFVDCI